MKLTKLLELHHQKSGGLTQNFGDGFLYKHNRIFRNIRDGAEQAGFRFSDEFNGAYQSLPFSQLEWILQNKTIPYVDNVTVLEQIARQIPSLQWQDLSEGLKKNFVFHESSHAVIRSLTSPLKTTDSQSKTLRILLEEAFANTCELLAVADAQDSAHRIYFETNSYTALFQERSHLANALQEFGEEVFMKFVWLCYLHSNFLHEGLSETSFTRTYQLASGKSVKEISPKQVKALKALSRIAFTLDLNFRVTTTRLHLQLSGLKEPNDELLNFDFLQRVASEPEWMQVMNAASRLALKV